MNEETKNHILNIEQKFPDSFLRIEEFRDETTLVVKKNDIHEIMKYLKESKETAFDFLVDVTAVDYLDIGGDERFAVIYHLHSYTYLTRIRVRAYIPEDDANIPSMVPLWQSANWPEREVAEMFGIDFSGHPDLRILLLPEDYPNHPLKKDFPLQGVGYRDSFTDLREE